MALLIASRAPEHANGQTPASLTPDSREPSLALPNGASTPNSAAAQEDGFDGGGVLPVSLKRVHTTDEAASSNAPSQDNATGKEDDTAADEDMSQSDDDPGDEKGGREEDDEDDDGDGGGLFPIPLPIPLPTPIPLPLPIPTPRPSPNPPPLPLPLPAPVPSPQSPPVPVPHPEPGGDYYVQVHATPHEHSICEIWLSLKETFPDLFAYAEQSVSHLDREGGAVWFRLRVGAFETAEDAGAFCERLKRDGHDCFVAPRPHTP